MSSNRSFPPEVYAYALQAWASGEWATKKALSDHMATIYDRAPSPSVVRHWIAVGRTQARIETPYEYALRRARDGLLVGNITSECRERGTPITRQEAQRAIREARLSGMKLYTSTKPGPWRTSAGHTITQAEGAYRIEAPGWEHPILFRARGFSQAVAWIEKHLGPQHLYVDGVYADDEDPELDLYDEEGLDHLPLMRGADMRRAA